LLTWWTERRYPPAAWINGTPAVLVNVQRQPGANIIQVVDRIKALLPNLTSTVAIRDPVKVVSDRTETIRASVSDVEFELALTRSLCRDGDLPLLADALATLYPALLCRCRWSAPSV